MDRAAAYQEAVAQRRRFSWKGFRTLAEAGLEGEWVSPIQMTSGNLEGPLLISKDWLDYPSAVAHRDVLRKRGYLPAIPFNRVIDLALSRIGLTRADIYISPIFHLLPPERSSQIPVAAARASFETIGHLEVMGRTPIALGQDAARVLTAFGVDHFTAPHPSARIGSFAVRAKAIADVLKRSLIVDLNVTPSPGGA